MVTVSRYVIARERNVIRVDFRREPDPPAPGFRGLPRSATTLGSPLTRFPAGSQGGCFPPRVRDHCMSRPPRHHERNCDQMPTDR